MKPDGETGQKILTRRDFLRSFARIKIENKPKNSVLKENATEPKRFALGALKDLPESALRQIVPVLRRNLDVIIRDVDLVFRGEEGETGVVSLGREACASVRLFDGRRTLEQIGSMLDVERLGQAVTGFELAREAFLKLSVHGIYHPAGPSEVKAHASEGPVESSH